MRAITSIGGLFEDVDVVVVVVVMMSLPETLVLLTGQPTIIIISCNQRLLLNKYEGLLVSPTDFQNWHKILFNHNYN